MAQAEIRFFCHFEGCGVQSSSVFVGTDTGTEGEIGPEGSLLAGAVKKLPEGWSGKPISGTASYIPFCPAHSEKPVVPVEDENG